MRFQIPRRVNEAIARIIATHILVLEPSWSFVKNLMIKHTAITIGIKQRQATGTYHQWINSLSNVQNTSKNKAMVMRIVAIPIPIRPHLIGKHPQQE